MKKLIVLFLLFGNLFQLVGQELSTIPADTTPTTKHLFSKSNIKSYGIYVSSEIAYGQYASAFTPIASPSVMLIFNNKFSIGVAASATLDRNFTPTNLSASNALAMRAGTAGLKMEYTFSPHQLIHFSLPITIGIGHVRVDSVGQQRYRGDRDNQFGNFAERNGVSFGFVQPGINAELNLFKYAKLYIGVNYRLATNLINDSNNTYALKTSQLSGLGVNLGLKVGLFDYTCKKRKRNQQPA